MFRNIKFILSTNTKVPQKKGKEYFCSHQLKIKQASVQAAAVYHLLFIPKSWHRLPFHVCA
jgi:hypothetical protein